ncbi:hypothetical protein [Myceligenerans pegani]|uniref:Uncharacterized protein n=1 Tax=Myceligenerans pegani TaxID=2776917 RepID=A0ABR9MTS0_9MICO|nr:hypothetical protein [Myceligenerans sp. TRM 65318]MBE1874298.1 hypothetical protein [Myceligenerans sp. TRM 65318]MBE3016569.1 hypothetical protein [Myceligenerans sp. TRM 65318]
MTDDAHALRPLTPIRATREPGDVPSPPRGRAAAAVAGAFSRLGRWLGSWARRLAFGVWFWAGLVVGFGTSLRLWESVLLLAVVGWIVGAWLWRRRRRSELIAVSVGVLLGWVPMLVLFVGALPHTMIGPPGIEYDI